MSTAMERITFTLDEEDKRSLRVKAAENDMTMSEYIRVIIEENIDCDCDS